ncbi:respiratory nitrate reductase subunit gamma [Nocardia bovistercoris]|uniref:Respiratory nitrate reductase subunit gamma n=1 Tax=Nocardia bovistercoris TaxID=2785916 RepID=A0A931IGN5_9NOCA|nr:respiratory nitrate reductase subunit gamma [Nocardia bovistercoris]MBH0780238.1 respiratory nitrate reductase subunit gamma [Nocardia bovistercoris]
MPAVLWILLPYLAAASFVTGHVWRYRRDRFRGFTVAPDAARTHRLALLALRIGFTLVLAARLVDLATAGHDSRLTGPAFAIMITVEGIGGVLTGVGGVLLLLPDLIGASRPVTPLDRITVPVLIAALFSGIAMRFDPNSAGNRYRTAETLYAWIRSLPSTHPNADAIAQAPVIYQARGAILMLIVAIWPYTRLSGIFAGPVVRFVRRYTGRDHTEAESAAER